MWPSSARGCVSGRRGAGRSGPLLDDGGSDGVGAIRVGLRLRLAALVGLAVLGPVATADDDEASALKRAIAYLAQEVTRWSSENRCFSCHNNGDGARALFAARELGYEVPRAALVDTTQWLERPSGWDENRGDPAFSDKKLARLQFASSLLAARQAGLTEEPAALVEAAESLLPYQESDGSWRVDAEGSVGSPTTWGAALATLFARRMLSAAGKERFQPAVKRADRWFAAARLRNTLDAAATVMAVTDRGLATDKSLEADKKLGEGVDLILGAQASDGGWGPYPKSPSEPFDTAVVLLALAPLAEPRYQEPIRQGRAYLLRTQLPLGGWPETTRPPGARATRNTSRLRRGRRWRSWRPTSRCEESL